MKVLRRVCWVASSLEDPDLNQPIGTFEEIGGVRCYVATPTVDYPKEKAILYLTDIFGIDLPNHQVRENGDLRKADSRLSADLHSDSG